MAGLLRGQLNKVMANELGLSVRTVEIHRANLMKKMQTKSLPELIKMALAIARDDLEGTAQDNYRTEYFFFVGLNGPAPNLSFLKNAGA